MPAVHEIISTLNRFAQARLPAGGWRGRSFDGTRLVWRGGMSATVAPEEPETSESVYAHAGAEPPLEEVLRDRVIHLVMQADRQELPDVRRLLEAVRRRQAVPIDPGRPQ